MEDDLISPAIFRGAPVTAFFTTRRTDRDFGDIARRTGVPVRLMYLPLQKHTDKIVLVESSLDQKVGDSVVTRRNDILIGVQVADCVPILMLDRKRRLAGAVHAGWRGTAEGILKKTIAFMSDRFFSDPADILIALGPGIRGCCYNVGQEVLDAVRRASGEGRYITGSGGINRIDLSMANTLQARSMGIPEANIWMSPDCTHCLPEKYHSYRFTRTHAGRQFGFIGLTTGDAAKGRAAAGSRVSAV